MCSDTVIKVIKDTCSNKVDFTIISSKSTSSVYCIIQKNNQSIKFRISDHYATKDGKRIPNLIYSKNTKRTTVERFVEKMINNLKIKSVKKLITYLNNA